ncbi:MAG: acyltransferase family protein, partial [Methanobacteriaceae archaeon]
LYIVPEVTMWYLLCLFLWRIFLPGLDKIRHVTILSIILAVLIGVLTFKGTFLSFSRFICFLPFFLGGFYYDSFKEKIQKFFSSNSTISKIGGNKIVNLVVLVVTALGSLYVLKNYSVEVLMLKANYDGLNMGSIEGMALRFMIIIASFIIIFCLINLMTSRNTFLVKWGQNSLSVYVLHYFLLWLIPIGVSALGIGFIFQNPIVAVLFVIIASAALTAILSIDKVTEGVMWLCNGVAKIVMKD